MSPASVMSVKRPGDEKRCLSINPPEGYSQITSLTITDPPTCGDRRDIGSLVRDDRSHLEASILGWTGGRRSDPLRLTAHAWLGFVCTSRGRNPPVPGPHSPMSPPTPLSGDRRQDLGALADRGPDPRPTLPRLVLAGRTVARPAHTVDDSAGRRTDVPGKSKA